MKKYILASMALSSLIFASDSCPDLSTKATDAKTADGIRIGLMYGSPIALKVYADSIKKFNNTDSADEFFSESLPKYGLTPIWDDLVSIRYVIDECGINLEKRQLLENEYEKLLDSIEPKNPDWCRNKTVEQDIKTEIDNCKKKLGENG